MRSTQQLVTEIARFAEQGNYLLATAESCTGGGVAYALTDIAGSSTWFDGGFVTYSNEAKSKMLGVRTQTLAKYGAVSEATVIEMAKGAMDRCNANLSVAISGIAGPDGGSEEKPVGMVWFAWCAEDGESSTALHYLHGDRHHVRNDAVVIALRGFLPYLKRYSC